MQSKTKAEIVWVPFIFDVIAALLSYRISVTVPFVSVLPSPLSVPFQ